MPASLRFASVPQEPRTGGGGDAAQPPADVVAVCALPPTDMAEVGRKDSNMPPRPVRLSVLREWEAMKKKTGGLASKALWIVLQHIISTAIRFM